MEKYFFTTGIVLIAILKISQIVVAYIQQKRILSKLETIQFLAEDIIVEIYPNLILTGGQFNKTKLYFFNDNIFLTANNIFSVPKMKKTGLYGVIKIEDIVELDIDRYITIRYHKGEDQKRIRIINPTNELKNKFQFFFAIKRNLRKSTR